MVAPIELNLIVAMDQNRGIGLAGTLPWTLRKDMALFKRLTSETEDPKKKNAVVMGRKTWFSIPERNRPLVGRFNFILSGTMGSVSQDKYPRSYVLYSWEVLLESLQRDTWRRDIEKIWVIGGNAVYKKAMESGLVKRIYITNIHKTYSCDVFFPEIPEGQFEKVPVEGITDDVVEDNGTTFHVEVWEKKE
ncbi:unnamed protein product [Cyprideis torosa]|uniref:dihydrofolate reductase n=1 Tax=Cyprideis torosa TaxID=163714 RepID=A0A7R8W1R5_9CRUS|nr:unnamed protein product [Cyprideis torosa]CAG0881030.1 unnamed protein product [Cyprideis torosa]